MAREVRGGCSLGREVLGGGWVQRGCLLSRACSLLGWSLVVDVDVGSPGTFASGDVKLVVVDMTLRRASPAEMG